MSMQTVLDEYSRALAFCQALFFCFAKGAVIDILSSMHTPTVAGAPIAQGNLVFPISADGAHEWSTTNCALQFHH